VSEDVIVLGSAGDFAKAFKGAHRLVLSQGQHGKYVVVAPAKWRLTGRSSRVPRNSRQ
jgi:hypothetical protein